MDKTRRRVSPRLAKISVSERRCYVKYAKKLMISCLLPGLFQNLVLEESLEESLQFPT
jgi:hypothetical protein